ncbi:MAG TPA: DEAD/DEAH box helicase, partial [Candidatus Acidoferrum sp.]|nr:DEAD/DEAH box helicase [Candidatus Acidoferrum sp.]
DWLEERRREGILLNGWDLPRPVPAAAPPTEVFTERQAATRGREAALREGVPVDPADRTPEEAGRWLLAGLIDWHRRDSKPGWWEYFRLRKLSPEDLFDEGSALVGLAYDGIVGHEKQSDIHRYRFDPRQETKIRVGKEWEDPTTGKSAGVAVGFDPLIGTIDLKRGMASAVPHPAALIEPGPISVKPLPGALAQLADYVIGHGLAGPGRYRAVRDLLLGGGPRIEGITPGEPLRHAGEDPLEAAVRLVTHLDESVLAIQGPPGTGKTYAGARMALALIAAGKRIGISAQSHKAITNFLGALDAAAREAGRPVRVIQRCDSDDDGADFPGVDIVGDSGDVAPALAAGRYDVAAGTVWLFGRDDMANAIDVLFIDEAGQLSLANVVAVGGCTSSIVLLGDPNQLPQVSNGSHPDGAGVSALEYVVGDAPTIAPDRGLLLDVTYRMHPLVNDFVSPVFYAGELRTDPSTARQSIGARPGDVHTPAEPGLGLRFVPVEHAGDETSSIAEAAAVADAVADLVGRQWTDARGRTRLLDLEDILIVAPYNAHVAEIERAVLNRFGRPGRIGTVDRFQGQEGAAAIYSMATSSPDEVPRGVEFLFDRHRLNVAVSRARGLSVLVASPELLRVRCHTPEQMRLANALCAYVEAAHPARGAPVHP